MNDLFEDKYIVNLVKNLSILDSLSINNKYSNKEVIELESSINKVINSNKEILLFIFKKYLKVNNFSFNDLIDFLSFYKLFFYELEAIFDNFFIIKFEDSFYSKKNIFLLLLICNRLNIDNNFIFEDLNKSSGNIFSIISEKYFLKDFISIDIINKNLFSNIFFIGSPFDYNIRIERPYFLSKSQSFYSFFSGSKLDLLNREFFNDIFSEIKNHSLIDFFFYLYSNNSIFINTAYDFCFKVNEFFKYSNRNSFIYIFIYNKEYIELINLYENFLLKNNLFIESRLKIII